MDLYFAAGPWSPAAGVDEKAVRFLCSDWAAYASLAARGAAPEAWEDHFPLEANAGAVKETERLATAWQFLGERDFTEMRGVSLGRAYRWLHWVTVVLPGYKFLLAVQELVRRHAPRVVHCDDSLSPEQRALLASLQSRCGFELRVVAGRRTGPEIQVWRPPRFALTPSKRLAASALNALGRLSGGRDKPVLLLSNYRALDPVLEQLCRADSPFRVAAADMPTKDLLPRFLRAGGELLTDTRTPPPADGEHAAACAAIRADWSRAKKDPAYLARFVTAGGDSLWPAFEPSLDAFFGATLESLAWVCARYHAYWDATPPAAVLLPFDEPPLQHLLMDLAQTRGTPVVTVLHGLPEAYHQLPFYDSATSALVVWGPEQKELYAKAGALKTRRGEALGNPAFDRRVPGAASPRRELKRVLALSQPSGWSVALATHLDPDRYALALAEVVGAFPQLEVTLRIHPSESLDYYRDLLGPASRLTLERGGSFADSLAKTDLLIASYSTALIDAMLAGVPLLCTQFNRVLYQPPFDGTWGVETVRAPEALKKRLAALLADPANGLAALRAPYPRILDRFAGPRDGKAAARVRGLLENLAFSDESAPGRAPRNLVK
ncbi:MAG: hypothetical protein SF051_09765 [Elusimicrobiota bacterium]|nr:hypothetical protein [Elusimicrobiota bacterium]